ncbi:MAG: PspC domain-containing protein [Lapillicoccus sp.]
MTQIPHGQQSAPTGSDGFWTWLRDLGIRRGSAGDKWFVGVSAGIARRLGIDPVLVRGAFILLTIFGGIGVLLYLVGWALLPDSDGDILAEQAIRHHNGRAIVLIVVIGLVVLGNLDGRWWVWTILLPTGLLLLWVFRSAKSGKSSDEIGKEAQEFATRVGETVSGWMTSSGSTGREARDQDTTTPYAASSPRAGTTPVSLPASTTPGASPHGMGPGRTGQVTPPAPQPPRVVQRHRKGAGFLGLLLALGLAVAAYVGGEQLASSRAWAGSTPAVFAMACALGALGVAVLLIGLSGRKAGLPGFIAILLTIVAVSGTATVPDVVRGGIGDRTWTAATAPESDYHLGVGDAKLDLTGATTNIDTAVGVGELIITVPAAARIRIDASVGVGDLTTIAPDGTKTKDDGRDSVSQAFGTGTGDPTVTVTAHVGLGDLTIKEQ